MKKKRIGLRGIEEILNERELKNTLGGCGGDYNGAKICYECMNGNTGYCPTLDVNDECWDSLAEYCPSGWTQWISGIQGPACY